MAATVKIYEAFLSGLKNVLGTYPKAEKTIKNQISSLGTSPQQGDLYPGFGGLEVRKLRIGLKEYGFGKSHGLRLIFIFVPNKNTVLPLFIYKKGRPGDESKVKTLVRQSIKQILAEIEKEEQAR